LTPTKKHRLGEGCQIKYSLSDVQATPSIRLGRLGINNIGLKQTIVYFITWTYLCYTWRYQESSP